MKTLTALAAMVVWSFAVWAVIEFVGFSDMLHDPLWSLGTVVLLLIGLIGNVWIYFLMIVSEAPWKWLKGENRG